jgi:hypothetical protein
MDLKFKKTPAHFLLAILFVIGVVCYAAFPHRAPEEPIRILFQSTAGNIVFDHKMHASEDGYAYECTACHHAWEEGEGKPLACGECHEVDGEESLKRSTVFHTQCIGCHEDFGTAPVDCAGCHAY